MIKKFKREWNRPGGRRTFAAIFGGKMIGVGACMLIAKVILGGIGADAGASIMGGPSKPAGTVELVSAANTLWLLLAAFLVFFMQAGFMFLEVGFARERETVNILLECIVDTCLCGLLFWAFGFAFMFGTGNAWIGHSNFFLRGAPLTYGSTGISFSAFFLFQYAFADTCSTITSGAMVGRTGFVGDLLYSVAVSGFIYPILGHWAWGPNGWLETMDTPFRDFAGSTVVHTIGGMIALAGAIVLGPRLGRKFKRDGGGMWPGHNMVFAALGGVILWFGWYGFNPGSTASILDFEGAGRVATNTTLAACAGGLSAMFIIYPRLKKWDTGITINGFLGGLVAITAPCYWVTSFGSIVIGAVAGVVVVLGVDLIEWLRIDDPIGAVAVHGFAGIWGTLSIGLLASGDFGLAGTDGPDTTVLIKGLFYGGGTKQLVSQVIGSVAIGGSAFVVAMIVMYVVKATKTLRISEEGELEGIDVHEHGAGAYHWDFGAGGSGATGAFAQAGVTTSSTTSTTSS